MNVGSKIGKLVTTARVARWRYFFVLRQLIFTIRPILLFLLEIVFFDFKKVPSTVSIDNIFRFVKYVQYLLPLTM